MKKYALITFLIAVLALIPILKHPDIDAQDPRPDNIYKDIEKQDCSEWSEISSAKGNFLLQNNVWGSVNVKQCIFILSSNSVGWTWQRNSSLKSEPNYPEIIAGNKPWGTESNRSLLPSKISNIESFKINNLSVNSTVEGEGKWNTALEIWITSKKPEGDVHEYITNEIIIVLEYNDLSEAKLIEEEAVLLGDKKFDLYSYEKSYEDYHQFRYSRNETPSEINLKPFIDNIVSRHEVPNEYWVTNIELGNEYWGNTSGETVVQNFAYTVNEEESSLRYKR